MLLESYSWKLCAASGIDLLLLINYAVMFIALNGGSIFFGLGFYLIHAINASTFYTLTCFKFVLFSEWYWVNSHVVLQVLFFSTMTRLLDVMEEYLVWKQYRYLRLDGHTSGLDRGALIEQFNRPDSPYFIFLLRLVTLGMF